MIGTYNPAQEYNGMFGYGLKLSLAGVTDGSSNTFMIGERAMDPSQSWGWTQTGCEGDGMIGTGYPMKGGPFTVANGYTSGASTYFNSHHVGGAHFLMGDGSVRFVSTNINFTTFQNLGTRAGGEVVSDF